MNSVGSGIGTGIHSNRLIGGLRRWIDRRTRPIVAQGPSPRLRAAWLHGDAVLVGCRSHAHGQRSRDAAAALRADSHHLLALARATVTVRNRELQGELARSV